MTERQNERSTSCIDDEISESMSMPDPFRSQAALLRTIPAMTVDDLGHSLTFFTKLGFQIHHREARFTIVKRDATESVFISLHQVHQTRERCVLFDCTVKSGALRLENSIKAGEHLCIQSKAKDRLPQPFVTGIVHLMQGKQ